MGSLKEARALAVLETILTHAPLRLDGHGMQRLRFRAGATSRQVEAALEHLAAEGLVEVRAEAGAVIVRPEGGAE